MHYIKLGSTGAGRTKEGPGLIDHVMWIAMTDAGPRISNLKLSGILDKELIGGDPEIYIGQ